jgi:uncharacterized protein
MMSEENVEIVRRTYEAWNCGDLETAFRSFDADIEWHLPEGGINTGVYRGHRGVRQLIESYLEAFDYSRMEPERFFETGDRIVAFVHWRVRGKGSGVEVGVRPAHLWTMRDGKAVRVDTFPEREREMALEAVGLSEQDAHLDPS